MEYAFPVVFGALVLLLVVAAAVNWWLGILTLRHDEILAIIKWEIDRALDKRLPKDDGK